MKSLENIHEKIRDLAKQIKDLEGGDGSMFAVHLGGLVGSYTSIHVEHIFKWMLTINEHMARIGEKEQDFGDMDQSVRFLKVKNGGKDYLKRIEFDDPVVTTLIAMEVKDIFCGRNFIVVIMEYHLKYIDNDPGLFKERWTKKRVMIKEIKYDSKPKTVNLNDFEHHMEGSIGIYKSDYYDKEFSAERNSLYVWSRFETVYRTLRSIIYDIESK